MKEQNKPETKIAAQNHSGFNLYSMTDTAYEKYLSFIEGANWMKGQLYTADQCEKMLEALRQRCAEEARVIFIDSDIPMDGIVDAEVDQSSITGIDVH